MLSLYLLTTPFTKLFYHPSIGYSVQFPELIFLLLLGVVLSSKRLRNATFNRTWGLLDYSVCVLLLSQFIAILAGGHNLVNKALCGEVYLVLFYFIGRGLLSGEIDLESWIKTTVFWFGALIVLSILGSWAYLFLFPEGTLELSEMKYLPGIGYFNRIEALTMSPNMLMNMLMLPVFVSFVNFLRKRQMKLLVWTFLLVVMGVATLSKSLILLILGLGLLTIHVFQIVNTLSIKIAGVILVASFFFVSSKFLFIGKTQADRSIILEQSYATQDLVYTGTRWDVFKSMHFILNQEALSAFYSSPVFGIGPDQFVSHIKTLKAEGLYPVNKLAYSPHSLYLGILAQSGILGFSALMFFLYAIAQKWWQLWQNKIAKDQFLVLGLGVFLLIWAIDGLCMDTLHFRHFWWVLIILGAWEANGTSADKSAIDI